MEDKEAIVFSAVIDMCDLKNTRSLWWISETSIPRYLQDLGITNISTHAVKQHIKKLKDKGLIVEHKEKQGWYSPADPKQIVRNRFNTG